MRGLLLDLGYKLTDLTVHSGPDIAGWRAIRHFKKTSLKELVQVGPLQRGTLDDLIRVSLKNQWEPDDLDLAQNLLGWPQINSWDQGLLSGIFRMFFLGDSIVFDLLEIIAEIARQLGLPEVVRKYLELQRDEEGVHKRFFKRVSREILGIDGDQHSLERLFGWLTLPSFNKSFRQLRLAVDRLRDCRSLEALVEAITIYHLIAEGQIAARGTLVVQDLLKGREHLLPGFLKGFKYVQQEESRHIDAGVMILARLIRDQPELARIVLKTLARMAKSASGINLPGMPKFEELVDHLGRRLRLIHVRPEAIKRVKELYPA